MTEQSLPELEDVQNELESLALAAGAAEIHGLLTGWLAAAGGDAKANWLAAVLADPAIAKPGAESLLFQLGIVTDAQLNDSQFGFSLLMPDDSETVDIRSAALLEWCGGFIGGLGLAGADPAKMSDEGKEAFDDILDLSRANLQFDDDAEVDEESLEQIAEYVRMAALFLHGELAMASKYRKSLN